MVKESDNQANQTVSSATKSTKTDTSAKAPTSNKTEDKKPTKKPSKKTKFNDDIKRGVAAAIWIYGSKSGWGNDPDRKKRLTAKFGASNAAAVQKYINAHANNGDLYDYWVKTGKVNYHSIITVHLRRVDLLTIPEWHGLMVLLQSQKWF